MKSELVKMTPKGWSGVDVHDMVIVLADIEHPVTREPLARRDAWLTPADMNTLNAEYGVDEITGHVVRAPAVCRMVPALNRWFDTYINEAGGNEYDLETYMRILKALNTPQHAIDKERAEFAARCADD